MDPLNELRRVYESRKGQYSCASFRYAIVRQREGETERLLILRGVVRFEPEKREAEAPRDYDRVMLQEQVVSPSDAFSIAERLLNKSTLAEPQAAYPGKYETRLYDSHERGLPVPSFERHLGNEWPSTVVYIMSSSQHVQDPQGPLVSLTHPLYTEAVRAVRDWLGVDALAVSSLRNGTAFMLPDLRLRIRRIVFSEHAATIQLDESEPDMPVLLKAGLGYGDDYATPEVRGAHGEYNMDLPRGIPSSFDLFVLHTETGEVLDWSEFYTGWRDLPRNVMFDVPAKQFERMIDEGESDMVEFKREVGDQGEFAETVIASANTGDGTILVGVDDHATVVGVTSPEKEEERIRNLIDVHCEPSPPVDVDHVTIQGKEILVARVRKGTNPPYMHRTRGVVYVRRGGTDRPAKRSDLDELYHGRGFVR